MSREDFVAIAARLFAIFLGVYALRTTFFYVQFMAQAEIEPGMVAGYAFVVAVMVAVALLLWFFPLSVARKLLPVMKEPRSEPNVGADTLFSLGLMMMGLWLLANAITDGVYWAAMLMAMRATGMPLSDLTPDQKAAMVTTVAEAVVALFLVFGSNGLRNAVYRFRNARVDTPHASGD
jgi:hypothetical protein